MVHTAWVAALDLRVHTLVQRKPDDAKDVWLDKWAKDRARVRNKFFPETKFFPPMLRYVLSLY